MHWLMRYVHKLLSLPSYCTVCTVYPVLRYPSFTSNFINKALTTDTSGQLISICIVFVKAMDARRSWVERTEGGEDHMKSKKKGRASQHLDDDDDDGPSYVAVNEFTSVTSTATLPHSCEYVLEDV